ncbi:MAG: glycerol kinase GlpK [Eubacterium sp.]|nr:glycerol kinase GlpK [Eubacterium sp.]
MKKKYIISIDQSTQGTKALLFDETGMLLNRSDLAHAQIVNEKGWVSHDLNEIYANTIQAVKQVIETAGKTGGHNIGHIEKSEIAALGISNQRETTAMWDRSTGEPLAHAVVWQCGRAESIGTEIAAAGHAEQVRQKTGIPLSGYFPACKMAWLLRNTKGAQQKADEGSLALGTMDSWLVYKLTGGRSFRTDYSNASRTQLFHLKTLGWDPDLCALFGLPMDALAEIADSNSCFGYTDFEGYLDEPIPIMGVLGDSHGALFGQGCIRPGMVKATYGTGSSLMMNIGKEPITSSHGVVTSVAWGMDGEVTYCLEGNLNYTGAVISWLKNDLKLIDSAKDTQTEAYAANPEDTTYLVPAFTGLGAPYWDAAAKAAIVGITRMTGKAEIIKAALECIAYQITDLVLAMEKDTKTPISQIRVDGGPSRNTYLMQFQSDLLAKEVCVPHAEELSGIGAAYAAGIAAGIYDRKRLFENSAFTVYHPDMEDAVREKKWNGWQEAVGQVLTKK